MHYLVSSEEIYFACFEVASIYGMKRNCYDGMAVAENDESSFLYDYYKQVLVKLENDRRLSKLSSGFLILKPEDKKQIEIEYGIKVIPIHPDDFTV